MSFIDEIYRDNKKKEYPRPSPGAYDIRQTEKQYKEEQERLKTRKIHVSQKMHSLTNDEFLGLHVPGPGSFNPRVSHIFFIFLLNRWSQNNSIPPPAETSNIQIG